MMAGPANATLPSVKSHLLGDFTQNLENVLSELTDLRN